MEGSNNGCRKWLPGESRIGEGKGEKEESWWCKSDFWGASERARVRQVWIWILTLNTHQLCDLMSHPPTLILSLLCQRGLRSPALWGWHGRMSPKTKCRAGYVNRCPPPVISVTLANISRASAMTYLICMTSTTHLLSVSIVLPFLEFHTNEINCTHLSLNTCLRFTHVHEHVSNSFLYIAE